MESPAMLAAAMALLGAHAPMPHMKRIPSGRQPNRFVLPFGPAPNSTDSRQQRRARAFKIAFGEISKQFGGEPRHNRRRMARALAKKALAREAR